MYTPLTMREVEELRESGDLAIEAQMQMLEYQFIMWLEYSKYAGE